MLEALAIGIPTVCTDCPPGGAAEYITKADEWFFGFLLEEIKEDSGSLD